MIDNALCKSSDRYSRVYQLKIIEVVLIRLMTLLH